MLQWRKELVVLFEKVVFPVPTQCGDQRIAPTCIKDVCFFEIQVKRESRAVSMRECATVISSKSYWHLSRTLATQTGMTNDWLKAQGLVSIRELWTKAHGHA